MHFISFHFFASEEAMISLLPVTLHLLITPSIGRAPKHSQCVFFGGLIGQRASKQDTVTIPTTEAELLALAYAGKETLFVSRLLKELYVELDDKTITIKCDNKQTINLVQSELTTLKINDNRVEKLVT